MVNAKSGLASVVHRARPAMRDDGGIEERVALIGPRTERFTSPQSLADSDWQEVELATFVAAWEEELATIPEFTDDTIHLVTGLLLPIWNQLPTDSARVYRLQTDDGEQLVGRRVSAAWVATASAIGGVTMDAVDAHAALLEGDTILSLSTGLQLRRVRAMGANRIELTGFDDRMRDRLKAYGLFHEIISWKLRMFVPTDEAGITVLAKLFEAWPIERISERAAA